MLICQNPSFRYLLRVVLKVVNIIAGTINSLSFSAAHCEGSYFHSTEDFYSLGFFISPLPQRMISGLQAAIHTILLTRVLLNICSLFLSGFSVTISSIYCMDLWFRTEGKWMWHNTIKTDYNNRIQKGLNKSCLFRVRLQESYRTPST